MMTKIYKKLAGLTIASFILSGCNENMTYEYLMENPQVLKHEVLDCQSSTEKSQREISQCEIVMYAASNFNALVTEQQSDPEKFGQRIMETETTVATIKASKIRAEQMLATLKGKKASPAEMKSAQVAVDGFTKALRDKKTELKILLAVMGLNSPE